MFLWMIMLCGAAAAPLFAGEPVTAPTPTAAAAEEIKKPEPLLPLFVKNLTEIEAGRNDGNPAWSRSGFLFTFERSTGDKREIRVLLADATPVQTVYYLPSSGGGEMKFFFPGVVEDISYNTGITWSPDEYRFAFMSNGGAGNYDLYLGDLGSQAVKRVTEHKDKDGQADWSPKGDRIVFVSGRTGKGDLYLLDVATRALTRLTQGGKEFLYPQWSPDGKRIVFMGGSSEDHNIYVIDDVTRPAETRRALTTWNHDDIRPVWSRDGKKIAFYSNYNPAGDPRIWSIMVVNADGSDPADGESLAARVAAFDVISDVERGPAWTADSSRIVYVKNDRLEYNPIHVVNIADKSDRPLHTETKMNHDIACGPEGSIAFRAQVNQWDQIFIAKMKE